MIGKLIPKKIKKVFYDAVKKHYGFKNKEEYRDEFWKEFVRERLKEDTSIPKVNLQQKHINNLKVLLDREIFLEHMPKDSICAEIGVNKGDFTELILKHTSPKKIHLVDSWGDSLRYHQGLKDLVKKRFHKEISVEKVILHHGYSTIVLNDFPDYYFDWVYLDTAHTYQITFDELKILKNKVKPTGIIAGHDYTIGNWSSLCRYGVIEAVHELCVADNWELIYLTTETHQCRNFAIRKLN